ncbi:MAG: ATP-binding cassette domain-containing protein [Armatimonadota bacterium]|nr:MAG: ATP-binding cassette domain-containing protein [Armatimonadota bacterium]
MSAGPPLVEITDLTKHFLAARERVVHAVDGVTLDIARGETLGLVGESGCGKSTLGRLICRLEDPTRGRIVFDGVDTTALSTGELRDLRPRMQMIFQDPFSSLNPHKTVEQIIALPLRIKGVRTRAEVRDRVAELLGLVGLDPGQRRRFPHQFSGGQRQRIGIARALACEPELVIADEPVASLDVSIQAQILEILRGLQERFRLTALFISHDISVVSHVSRRIAVMYLGKVVEVGPAQAVIEDPRHPYTRALLAAVPRIERGAGAAATRLPGDVPSPMAVPPGCRFHTRCYLNQIPECRSVEPDLFEAGPGHLVACHLVSAVGTAAGAISAGGE